MSRALPTLADRYTITRELAAGGMATVYLGRLAGPGGFSRPVAIKRPHAHVARHPEFRAMLLDEGRLAASISHPNVVSTLDVVADGDDLFLVMEYVPGETLAQIQRAVQKENDRIPPRIACAILDDVLQGLWAVHSARDERGESLDIVHRDISPQNILVGQDGITRILDFGVAKAARRLQVTRDGQLKGKIAYMAPEQMQGNVTERTDVYAASIVLWEALAGKRLFTGEDEVEVFSKALASAVEPPSKHARGSANLLDGRAWSELDRVVLRGLARNPADRFASAKDMASALKKCVPRASVSEVSAWLARTTSEDPGERAKPAGDDVSNVVTVNDAGMGDPLATLTEPRRDELALQLVAGGESARTATMEAELPVADIRGASPPALKRGASWRRRAAIVALGAAATASMTFVATRFATSHGRTSNVAQAAASSRTTPVATLSSVSADPVASAGVEPPAAAAGPQPGAGGTRDGRDGPEAANAAPHARGTAPQKNHVERARRAPVISQAIDVSHAIDERH